MTIATNMAGRGTDILLGGNPEFLAREMLAGKDYTEEEYKKALEKAKEICKEEHDKVVSLEDCILLEQKDMNPVELTIS